MSSLAQAALGSAQSIRGVVREEASGLPVPAVTVILVAADSSVAGTDQTGDDGRFAIRAAKPGVYRVRAFRIGYYESATETLRLVAGQDVDLSLAIRSSALSLEPVRLSAEQPARRLVREGFYARRARGVGYFRTAKDVEKMIFPDDLFRGVSGIRIAPNGRVLTTSYHRPCALSVAIDGFLVQKGGPSDPSRAIGPSWTDLVHVSDIEAVEVYPRAVGVPAWLFGPLSPCGAIVIWTKGSR